MGLLPGREREADRVALLADMTHAERAVYHAELAERLLGTNVGRINEGELHATQATAHATLALFYRDLSSDVVVEAKQGNWKGGTK